MSKATPVAVLAAGQVTFFARFIDAAKADIQKIEGEVATEVKAGEAAVVDFFEHEAEPFVENFLKSTALDELAMVKDEATAAADELLPDVGVLFTEPGKFLGMLTAVIESTTQKVLAKGISIAQADAKVAESTIATAALAAIHNKIAASKAAS